MNRRQSTSIVLLALLLTGSVQAQVYKCKQPDGSTEISNMPCAKGSSTVKTVPSETVSEQTRREAERNVEQMRKEADKLEATRVAEESARRQAASTENRASAPSAVSIENCLRDLERLALDAGRRAELEAQCRSGNGGQPVYVPVPVYSGPGYVRPLPPQTPPQYPRPPVKPRPDPEPLPQPLNPPANKGNAIFAPANPSPQR
jgi:hypothetical protein